MTVIRKAYVVMHNEDILDGQAWLGTTSKPVSVHTTEQGAVAAMNRGNEAIVTSMPIMTRFYSVEVVTLFDGVN